MASKKYEYSSTQRTPRPRGNFKNGTPRRLTRRIEWSMKRNYVFLNHLLFYRWSWLSRLVRARGTIKRVFKIETVAVPGTLERFADRLFACQYPEQADVVFVVVCYLG